MFVMGLNVTNTMNKLLLIFSLFFTLILTAQISYTDLQDKSGGITDGYGSWGEHNVIQENAIDVAGKGSITFYHPEIATTKKPTIFFISGWGRPAYTYKNFFYFMASHGYAVVNIYNTEPGNIKQSYQNSLEMMVATAETHFSDWIDTQKVGFMGHSYGAGATIWLGKKLFGENYNWGKDGRFIFMTAPWYSLLVSPEDLINYPDNVKLLIEVNNDDVTTTPGYTWNTDERAIRAMYQLINIPNAEKDFIRIFSDPKTYEYNNTTYAYDASHYISYTASTNSAGVYQTYDALDVFAINRLSHALIDYVFEGNQEGKNVALGNGSTAQKDMGFLTDLSVTDTPVLTRPENEYKYKCTSNWNDFADNANVWFLQEACTDSDGDGIIDAKESLAVVDELHTSFSLYPIPTSDKLQIRFKDKNEKIIRLEIFDSTGKLLSKKKRMNILQIDVSNLLQGVYFIKIQTEKKVGIQSFLIR